MIKEVPEELADEFEQTELTFTIYHNGYKNALGVKEVNGTYTMKTAFMFCPKEELSESAKTGRQPYMKTMK